MAQNAPVIYGVAPHPFVYAYRPTIPWGKQVAYDAVTLSPLLYGFVGREAGTRVLFKGWRSRELFVIFNKFIFRTPCPTGLALLAEAKQASASGQPVTGMREHLETCPCCGKPPEAKQALFSANTRHDLAVRLREEVYGHA